MILILFMPNVKGLGILQKSNYQEIKPGQIATFSILLWNQEPIEIEFKEKLIPEEWLVIVEPKKFILDNNNKSSELIRLQDSYVKALPVKILTIPPEDVKPGIYDITINMVAGKNNREINFFQEKNFDFKINISGTIINQKENVNESIIKDVNKTGNFINPVQEIGKVSSDSTKIIFWLIIIVITILACWFLYKL